MNIYLKLCYQGFFVVILLVQDLHNTCWLKKDVSERIDKEGVTSGFITDECKGKKIRFKRKIHDCEINEILKISRFVWERIAQIKQRGVFSY